MKIQPLCGAAGLPGFKTMMKIVRWVPDFNFTRNSENTK